MVLVRVRSCCFARGSDVPSAKGADPVARDPARRGLPSRSRGLAPTAGLATLFPHLLEGMELVVFLGLVSVLRRPRHIGAPVHGVATRLPLSPRADAIA